MLSPAVRNDGYLIELLHALRTAMLNKGHELRNPGQQSAVHENFYCVRCVALAPCHGQAVQHAQPDSWAALVGADVLPDGK